jgi:hypothetical protein
LQLATLGMMPLSSGGGFGSSLLGQALGGFGGNKGLGSSFMGGGSPTGYG